jgi:thiamine biosynthesis lipoprotein
LRPWLGTFVEIRVAANGAHAERAIEAGFAAISLVHEKMSPLVSASDVSRLRRSATGGVLQLHPWTWEVLSVAQLFAAWSNGEFDPTLSRRARDGGNWYGFEILSSNRVCVRGPVPDLDLGGIAKGFAVDRAVDALRVEGIESGAVNAGGDLRAFGSVAQPLAIRDPQTPSQIYHLGILQDEAVATSTNATDPRGGGRLLRARGRRLWIGRGSASVRAASCMMADALCKVVAAMGPKGAQSLLEMCDASAMVLTRGEMISIGNFHRAA